MNDTSLVCDNNILVLVTHPDDSASFTVVRLSKGTPQVAIRAYLLYKKRRSLTRFAIQVLTSHPLVLSFTRATSLVDEYLKAHAAYAG